MYKLWPSLALLVVLLPMMVSPAYSTIYVWKDANGVNNATDDPRRIPSGVQVRTLSYDAVAPVKKETLASVDESETWIPTTDAKTSDHVSQGEFAVLLVAELGLGDGLSPQAAADVLSDALIAPRLGDWHLNAPMTQGLLDRLGNLTLAAARVGRIPIGLDEARLAFDIATALAGISGDFVEAPLPTYTEPTVVRKRIIVVEDVSQGHRRFIHKHGHGLGFKHAVRPKRHRRHAKIHVGSKHKHKIVHRKKHRTRMPGVDRRRAKLTYRRTHVRTANGAVGLRRATARRTHVRTTRGAVGVPRATVRRTHVRTTRGAVGVPRATVRRTVARRTVVVGQRRVGIRRGGGVRTRVFHGNRSIGGSMGGGIGRAVGVAQ